ncbi:MAG: phosphotransferase family protein [Candidatus Thorarchaeota archaeon]
MMKYPVKTVHGHSHSELEVLLEDSCDAFDDFINLEHTSMGGWSNINIRGQSSGFDFVLKLPALLDDFTTIPYEKQYNLNLLFSRLDIAPHPIEFGRLSDSAEIPFYLEEFVEGTTHSELTDVSESELLSLKESLRILNKQKLSGVPVYETPTDLLLTNHDSVETHDWLHKASTKTKNLIDQFDLLFPTVNLLTDDFGYWSKEVIHGDLWVPNVIFRPEQNALLLDFETCAVADSRYDLVRLLEGHEENCIEHFPSLFLDEDINFINSLRPLVIAYVIDWCIERLLSMESGIVESNLNSPKIHSMVLDYGHQQLEHLKSILH